ncbi:MAG: hypothetical protein RLZZ253_3396 [Verrucomicrobiota bacterium]|jgi:hypothetical protein
MDQARSPLAPAIQQKKGATEEKAPFQKNVAFVNLFYN